MLIYVFFKLLPLVVNKNKNLKLKKSSANVINWELCELLIDRPSCREWGQHWEMGKRQPTRSHRMGVLFREGCTDDTIPFPAGVCSIGDLLDYDWMARSRFRCCPPSRPGPIFSTVKLKIRRTSQCCRQLANETISQLIKKKERLKGQELSLQRYLRPNWSSSRSSSTKQDRNFC